MTMSVSQSIYPCRTNQYRLWNEFADAVWARLFARFMYRSPAKTRQNATTTAPILNTVLTMVMEWGWLLGGIVEVEL